MCSVYRWDTMWTHAIASFAWYSPETDCWGRTFCPSFHVSAHSLKMACTLSVTLVQVSLYHSRAWPVANVFVQFCWSHFPCLENIADLRLHVKLLGVPWLFVRSIYARYQVSQLQQCQAILGCLLILADQKWVLVRHKDLIDTETISWWGSFRLALTLFLPLLTSV